MSSRVIAEADDLPLSERIRASQLPPPDERQAIRERSGATLREVAAELGVAATTVLNWERGKRQPRRADAIAYRRVLDSLKAAA